MSSDQNLESASAIALMVAGDHRASMLPCPACGAEVKGENLERHLGKVHDVQAPTDRETLVLAATDRRMFVVSLIPLVLGLAAVPALLAIQPGPGVGAAVALVAFVVLAAPMMLTFLERFRATVTVDSGGVELRWCLGLARTRVEFPVQITSGALIVRRSDSVMVRSGENGWGPASDHHAGGYVELIPKSGRGIVLGARRGPRLGKYWNPKDHTKGGKRRWWDAELAPEGLVQLQYALARYAELRVRDHAQ